MGNTSLFLSNLRLKTLSYFNNIKLLFDRYCFYMCGTEKHLKKSTCLFILFIFLSLGYVTFQKLIYGNVQVFKNDIRIESIIKAAFPMNYNIEIKKGDMVGLGDNFYIAYGNKTYVNKLYASQDIKTLDSYAKRKEVNFPIVKIFYLQESSIFEPIFSLIPDFINNYILEWRINELYTYKPIIVLDEISNIDKKDKKLLIKNYTKEFSGLPVFYISDVKVADIDNDEKDEVICTWIAFGGGSGGTKISTIIEFIDRKLSISSGYPDTMDYESMSYMQAFLKYSGEVNKNQYSKVELQKLVYKFEESYNLDLSKFGLFNNKKTTSEDLNKIANIIGNIYTPDLIDMYNLEDQGQVNKIAVRHTDIYDEFVKYDDQIILLEAFYLPDQMPHWGKHEWFIYGFVYKDGRWLLDRNINNKDAIGAWLNWNKKYTIHEIHGTYDEANNFGGLAWSFINPEWNPYANNHANDLFGIGTKTISPVKSYVDKIYK